MDLLVEIVARDAAADESSDAQQAFHALAFPAKHGARVIQRLTAVCGSLVDLGFPHLKRMKKHDGAPGTLLALLVPVAVASDTQEQERLPLSEALSDELHREFDGELCVVHVLKRAPKTREAWEAHTKQWPLIFHASVAPEALVEPITEREAHDMAVLVRHAVASGAQFRDHVEAAATREPGVRRSFCCATGCVIADPTGSRDSSGDDAYAVVADSLTQLQTDEHDAAHASYAFRPLFHPVMVAIDGVAARDRVRGEATGGPSRKHRRVGSAATKTEPTGAEAETETETETETVEAESYLCTGYDVFVDVEPCVMCAMALVHSRARRVVFATLNATDGALASVHRLHTIKSLNHRYRVFHLPVSDADKAA